MKEYQLTDGWFLIYTDNNLIQLAHKDTHHDRNLILTIGEWTHEPHEDFQGGINMIASGMYTHIRQQ